MKTQNSIVVMLSFVAVLSAANGLGDMKPLLDDSHDRVQTTLDPQMDRIGTLTPRSAKAVGRSHLAIGCEMLPREYGDFDKFKEYLPPLGISRVRLHAGWAKLEPKPGVWDWDWLDRQVKWLVEHELEPLLETSYGNPAYPGAGGASLSDGIPRGDKALAAWDNYVDKLASRYSFVKDWACWNEPNNDTKLNPPEMLADNNIRTARIIKRHIPDARIGMLTLSWCDMAYTKTCFKVFKEQKALDLFHWAIMHDYSPNPDVYYTGLAVPWAKYVQKEAPHLKIWNGESGATSDPHFSAPISSLKWNTELTQAKWDARRLVADLGHGFDSLVFTIYDPCYADPKRYCNHVPDYWVRTKKDRFMKRMGLLKCNDRYEVVKVKPAYYTVQNVATLFDATIEPDKFQAKPVQCERAPNLVIYTFRQKHTKIPLIALWDSSDHPSNDNTLRHVSLEIRNAQIKDPVWIDLVTGAIYRVPDRMALSKERKNQIYENLPYYDAPAVLTERSLVIPLNTNH